MSSNINPAVPPFGSATTSGVRSNFAAAKSEIEDLQMSDTLDIALVNDTVQTFYLCSVNNTPQVVPFSESSVFPPASTMYSVNLANGEVTFNQPGKYSINVSAQIIRQNAGVASVDWMVWTELKLPGGSFVPSGARKHTFNTDSTNAQEFFSSTRVGIASVGGVVGRVMQACTDVTKNVGLVSTPASGLLPRVEAMSVRISRLGPV